MSLEADILPGERLLGGRVYIFDADLRNAELGRRAMKAATDLTVMTVEELISLRFKILQFCFRGMPEYEQASSLNYAITAEYRRRDLDSMAQSKKAIQVATAIRDAAVSDMITDFTCFLMAAE